VKSFADASGLSSMRPVRTRFSDRYTTAPKGGRMASRANLPHP
jgi:hypothetical protein